MARNEKAPAGKAGAQRDCLAGSSLPFTTADAARMQILTARFGLSTRRALVVAPLIWGGAVG
jgi:hypothetical protein